MGRFEENSVLWPHNVVFLTHTVFPFPLSVCSCCVLLCPVQQNIINGGQTFLNAFEMPLPSCCRIIFIAFSYCWGCTLTHSVCMCLCLCVHTYTCMHTTACMWRSQNNLELGLSYHVGPRAPTQVIRLGGRVPLSAESIILLPPAPQICFITLFPFLRTSFWSDFFFSPFFFPSPFYPFYCSMEIEPRTLQVLGKCFATE